MTWIAPPPSLLLRTMRLKPSSDNTFAIDLDAADGTARSPKEDR